MRTRLILLLCSIILLPACSWTHPVLVTPVARTGLRLAPATFGTSIIVQQHLIVEHPDHTDQLDTALEIDPQHLSLVGLAFGQRVMTLQYNGKDLQIWRHPMLPKEVRGEDVLEDLELTLWPTNIIRSALPSGWSIQENNKQRILLLNNTPVMVINYSSNIRWQGTVKLINLRYHYRLIIQSVGAPLVGAHHTWAGTRPAPTL